MAKRRPVLKLNEGDPSEQRLYYLPHYVAAERGFSPMPASTSSLPELPAEEKQSAVARSRPFSPEKRT